MYKTIRKNKSAGKYCKDSEVTGHPIPSVTAEHRPGDPAKLVADSNTCKERTWLETCI
ncbi:MAG TPA: hypothetical protein QF753_10490 [Victivallales bacterium]|nr:hypothetical protein [Victivallales bacterium]